MELICPLRHDWYQTESQVTITIMLKNAKKEEVTVMFEEKEVTVFLYWGGVGSFVAAVCLAVSSQSM